MYLDIFYEPTLFSFYQQKNSKNLVERIFILYSWPTQLYSIVLFPSFQKSILFLLQLQNRLQIFNYKHHNLSNYLVTKKNCNYL